MKTSASPTSYTGSIFPSRDKFCPPAALSQPSSCVPQPPKPAPADGLTWLHVKLRLSNGVYTPGGTDVLYGTFVTTSTGTEDRDCPFPGAFSFIY